MEDGDLKLSEARGKYRQNAPAFVCRLCTLEATVEAYIHAVQANYIKSS